jgi:hypothetical protein
LLDKHGLPAGKAWASLLRATVEKQRANRSRAERHLSSALDAFDTAEMKLYREGTRYCLGELSSNGHGADLKARASAFMSEQEIANPRRMVHMLAAGFLDARD